MITSVITDSKDPKIFQGPREFPNADSGKSSMKNNSANVTQMDLVFNDKYLEHPAPQRRNQAFPKTSKRKNAFSKHLRDRGLSLIHI